MDLVSKAFNMFIDKVPAFTVMTIDGQEFKMDNKKLFSHVHDELLQAIEEGKVDKNNLLSTIHESIRKNLARDYPVFAAKGRDEQVELVSKNYSHLAQDMYRIHAPALPIVNGKELTDLSQNKQVLTQYLSELEEIQHITAKGIEIESKGIKGEEKARAQVKTAEQEEKAAEQQEIEAGGDQDLDDLFGFEDENSLGSILLNLPPQIDFSVPIGLQENNSELREMPTMPEQKEQSNENPDLVTSMQSTSYIEAILRTQLPLQQEKNTDSLSSAQAEKGNGITEEKLPPIKDEPAPLGEEEDSRLRLRR